MIRHAGCAGQPHSFADLPHRRRVPAALDGLLDDLKDLLLPPSENMLRIRSLGHLPRDRRRDTSLRFPSRPPPRTGGGVGRSTPAGWLTGSLPWWRGWISPRIWPGASGLRTPILDEVQRKSQGSGISSQRGELCIVLAGFQPGHGRLRSLHELRHVCLGEAGGSAAPSQPRDQVVVAGRRIRLVG